MNDSIHNVVVIGAGRVGRALAEYIHDRGLHLLALIDTAVSRCERVRATAAVRSSLLQDIPEGADLVLLCVPDAAISAVSSRLATAAPLQKGILIAHTSGLLPAAALQDLQDAEMCTGNLHPIQSFPNDDVRNDELRGIGCGIEGEAEFIARIAAFCGMLDWKPVHVDPRNKAAYHAACVMAGNFPVVLAAQAEAVLHNAGIEASFTEHLRPMMQTVVERLDTRELSAVLSGPAARGDWETMRRHLAALTELHPEALALYRVLTEAALHLGGAKDETEFFQ